MKVLLVNRRHFIGGGADRVYLNTGKLLEDNGLSVVYFSTRNNRNVLSKFERYFADNIILKGASIFLKIFSIGNYLYNVRAYFKIKRLVLEHKPDVAHIHLFYGVLSGSILVALKRLGVPVVVTIHDYRLLCPANAFLDKNNKICEKCINDNFINCTKNLCSDGNIFQSFVLTLEAYLRKYFIKPSNFIVHFIFVSSFSLRKHLEFKGYYRNNSTILYNFAQEIDFGIDVVFGDHLFFYGRLSVEKGILTLIKAIKEKNVKLKIAGSGPLLDEVLRQIEFNTNIEYLGFLDFEEIKKYILESRYVVIPSEWYENNPMTIIESYSFGKPVIAARIGGIPEIVSQETGFLFESFNVESLSETIDIAYSLDSDAYSKLSLSCMNYAQKMFNKDVHYRKLIMIYEKLKNVN